MKMNFKFSLFTFISIALLVQKTSKIILILDSQSAIDVNANPSTIKASSQYSIDFYISIGVQKTDKIVITFPAQIKLTNGVRTCIAVKINLPRHHWMIQH